MPHANQCHISTRCWQPQLKFERPSALLWDFFCWCFRQWSCVLNTSCSVLLWGNPWSTRPKIEAIRMGKNLSDIMAHFFDNAGFLPLQQYCQMCVCCSQKLSCQKFFPQFLNADHHRKRILYLNFCGFLVLLLIHIKELWLEKNKFNFSPFSSSSVTFLKANHSSWSVTSKTSWFTFKYNLSFTFLIKGE